MNQNQDQLVDRSKAICSSLIFIIPAAVAVAVTEDNGGQDDNKKTQRENHSGFHDTIFLGVD